MRLVALDASTEACSAALLIEGEISERFIVAKQQHSSLLLPMIDGLLAESGLRLTDLDCLVFTQGPGSFTGLRIATGVVQGLAYAADLPVVPVSTLATLAEGCEEKAVITILDARMQQVYWACYKRDEHGPVLQNKENIDYPDQIEIPRDATWVGIGSGWDQYADVLMKRAAGGVSFWKTGLYPHARHAASLGARAFIAGKAIDAQHAVPVYLRDHVAEKQPQ